jgi:hypothetical protein
MQQEKSPMSRRRPFVRSCFASLMACLCCIHVAYGDEPADVIRLDAPKGWRGERIEIPPAFAPGMKLKGVEVIRFAEGMFQPGAKDFFSYVIVFRLNDQPKLAEKTLQQELLTYYRGLANAVSSGKIDTSGFTIKVIKAKDSKQRSMQKYTATLQWIEPIATKKNQTLRLAIQTWEDPKPRHTWVLMSVSPNKSDDPIWKQMHEIRDRFLKNNGAGDAEKR